MKLYISARHFKKLFPYFYCLKEYFKTDNIQLSDDQKSVIIDGTKYYHYFSSCDDNTLYISNKYDDIYKTFLNNNLYTLHKLALNKKKIGYINVELFL